MCVQPRSNALRMNFSAKLYGGLVTIDRSGQPVEGEVKKSATTSHEPRFTTSEEATVRPALRSTLLIAPSPHAGSQIVPGKSSICGKSAVTHSAGVA